MSTAFATTANRAVAATPHYRAVPNIQPHQLAQRAGPNVTDDYERWYTEATPNNRMLLSLRSGIHAEIGWALDRLCRLCPNEQFVLHGIPGLTEALFEWPEWYAREGHTEYTEAQSLFALDRDQERKRRHALEALFVLCTASVNEPNALELANHPRTQPLIFLTLNNIQPDTDANTEFLLHAIDLLHAVSSKVVLPTPTPAKSNPLPPLEKIAGESSNRSLILASLTALTSILSNSHNITHLTLNSPAFQASLKYLPLFIDKPLVDACLNYLYIYLSHPLMAKAFLLHRDMPSALKLLVSHLLSEQVEESASDDVSGPVTTVPSLAVSIRDHELSQEELDNLLEKPEPQRCYEWMKAMFLAKSEGELTQVDFWNLYKDVFLPFQDRFPLLVASDVIKNVNVVFPQAQAMVLPGPPQKFVVRGVDRRKETMANERFKCQWDRGQCPAAAFDSPAGLYDHLLETIAGYGPELACMWSSCSHPAASKAIIQRHVLTHLSSTQAPPKHPSQSDTITLVPGVHSYPTSNPTTRPPPPPPQTTVTFPRPVADPSSSSLTALLCIRILFRASFTSTDAAPRADADHFGFPGVVEDVDEQDMLDDGSGEANEQAGQKRGRQAFVGVRSLMEGVRIRDETLMGWITEMVDAGIFGMN